MTNQIEQQGQRGADIRYDHRWFYRREWQLGATLFPHIMRYNRTHVYRHEARGPQAEPVDAAVPKGLVHETR